MPTGHHAPLERRFLYKDWEVFLTYRLRNVSTFFCHGPVTETERDGYLNISSSSVSLSLSLSLSLALALSRSLQLSCISAKLLSEYQKHFILSLSLSLSLKKEGKVTVYSSLSVTTPIGGGWGGGESAPVELSQTTYRHKCVMFVAVTEYDFAIKNLAKIIVT